MQKHPLTRQAISLGSIAILFCTTGVLHFVATNQYVRVVPPGFPYPWLLVIISGIFEVLGGIGVLVPQARRTAGLGLIALLAAVFPANIYMFTRQLHDHGWTFAALILLLRLPLQFVIIWWVHGTCCRKGL